MDERIIELLGKKDYNKIKKAKILLVGLGGVGSSTFNALVRSGFKNITVIDSDLVEESNLNRQLVAYKKTIGMPKVDVAVLLAKEINEKAKIKPIEMFLSESNINTLDKDFDYIIDACDTINAKMALIKFSEKHHIKIISSMGMGNRVQAKKIKITTLDKTINDPIARILRKLVKDNNLNMKIPVVYNEDVPLKKKDVTSLITSPGIAGLLITDYIINDLLFRD